MFGNSPHIPGALLDPGIAQMIRADVYADLPDTELFNWDTHPLLALYHAAGGDSPLFYGNDKLLQPRQFGTEHYAWAVPDRETLEVIAKYSPLVEMGARRSCTRTGESSSRWIGYHRRTHAPTRR